MQNKAFIAIITSIKIEVTNLLSNNQILHQIITDLKNEVIALKDENDFLRHQLALLKKQNFGQSSEKLSAQIAELETQIEEGELVAELTKKPRDIQQSADAVMPKNVPKRQKLPEHLERIDEVINPEPICPECGGEEFHKIEDDISETLEYMPASFKVIRHIRPRCACATCEKILQAYPASKPISKGMAGPGLLAHILVQKYCNHLPFYRQSEIYAREEIDLSRSTMASWAGQSAALLMPLVEEIRKSIFASTHIHGDDTTIKVLAPGLGKTKIGRLWTYVRDGRKYNDPTPPAVCYFYSPDRKGIRPEEHLENFTGTLHADAYSGYNNLYIDSRNKEAKITEAACWAHTRRKFYEVTVSNPNANIAMQSLESIGKIYDIEALLRDCEADKRKEVRQQDSKLLVDNLFENWKKWQKDLPSKGATALAINYALNNEDALRRFLTDGKIEIDNNIAERAMRSIALGRKNWLFAGSDKGGETAAAIYTILETAKLNGVNPWGYLREVLKRIQDHNAKKVAELLPWNLKLDQT